MDRSYIQTHTSTHAHYQTIKFISAHSLSHLQSQLGLHSHSYSYSHSYHFHLCRLYTLAECVKRDSHTHTCSFTFTFKISVELTLTFILLLTPVIIFTYVGCTLSPSSFSEILRRELHETRLSECDFLHSCCELSIHKE